MISKFHNDKLYSLKGTLSSDKLCYHNMMEGESYEGKRTAFSSQDGTQEEIYEKTKHEYSGPPFREVHLSGPMTDFHNEKELPKDIPEF